MKFNKFLSKADSSAGMTLVEITIALAILGTVLSVCYGSSVALQHGFGYTSSWTEARTNQLRVLDSLALDLRNATKIDFISPAPTLVTLTLPNRYSGYEAAGALAGDPGQTASPTSAPPPDVQTGKIAYPAAKTITVTYARSTNGKTIKRTATGWSGAPAGGASRDVASFPNSATVTFTPNSPSVMTNTSGVTVITTKITTAPDYRHLTNQSTLEDKVFLRELSIR